MWMAAVAVLVKVAAGETLTLEDAVRQAVEHNRGVAQARIGVDQYDDRIAGAKTRRRPSFQVSSTSGVLLTRPTVTFERGAFGDFPGIGPVPDNDVKLRSPRKLSGMIQAEAALPLTMQHRIGLEIKQLELGKKIAREEVRRTQQEVTRDVRETYYAILQAQSSLEAVDRQLALLDELSATVGKYVKAGTALDGDLLEVKARKAEAEYQRVALEGPMATQMERLNLLMGRPLETAVRVAAFAEASWVEPELTEARVRAVASRPEMAQARLKFEQAVVDRRIQKSDSIPKVSLSTTYYSMVNLGSTLPSNIAIAGVSTSWEPFDWGRKRKEVSAKEKTEKQAALSVAETEDKIRVEVGSAHRKMQEARRMMAAAQAGEENAREQARLAVVRFRLDAALLKDVLQGQSGLATAQERMQKSLAAYWTARAALEKAMGEEQ